MERRTNYNQGYQNKQGGGYNQGYGNQNPEGGRSNYGGADQGNKGGYNQGQAYNQNRGPPRDNYQGKGGADFGNKPRYGGQEGTVARGGPPRSGKVNLFTNQFMMKIGGDLSVYIYEIQMKPESINDSFLTHSVFRMCKKKLEMMLGIYVISGNNIFTTCDIPESFKMNVEYKSVVYEIIIDAGTKSFFSGNRLNSLKMEDHNVAHTLINIIIKEAFRQTHLRQIGKVPRFFDTTKAIEIPGADLQVWPGFRASAFNYQSGLALVIDNVNKFMSTTSCLQRIQDIMHNCPKNP